jgi:hypothetical protein
MSHHALEPADRALVAALAASARGPERDGVFALWLVVRAALGGAALPAAPARQADRLKAVGQRVRNLTAPAPLRRSLGAALADLLPARGIPAAVVLSHLAAPAAESCPSAAAAAVLAAARSVRAPAAAETAR